MTDRERDIVAGVHDGLNNKTIARRYGISETTVKVHLQHIYRKLGLAGDGRYALRVKLALWMERQSEPSRPRAP